MTLAILSSLDLQLVLFSFGPGASLGDLVFLVLEVSKNLRVTVQSLPSAQRLARSSGGLIHTSDDSNISR